MKKEFISQRREIISIVVFVPAVQHGWHAKLCSVKRKKVKFPTPGAYSNNQAVTVCQGVDGDRYRQGNT